ncbi:MAG: hypothetical protein ACRC6I_05575 [Paracoccaceae bacterium]
MNYFLAAVWGAVIFGALTVVLLLLWFLGGRTSSFLRVAGGVTGLIGVACFAYMTYGA